MRSGLIVEKLGSSSLFTEKGSRIQVTLLKMDDCEILANRTVENNGYEAVVLAYGKVRPNKVSKPLKQVFANAKIEVKKLIKEFRVSPENMIEVGANLNVDHFQVGQHIDATSTSKGKGFAGVMKRHNFRGLEATHGVSITHRSHGSTGGRQDPGRVFKGKKMAGHLGDVKVTVQNLEVVGVRPEERLLIVKGSVPGCKGSYVYLKDSVKK